MRKTTILLLLVIALVGCNKTTLIDANNFTSAFPNPEQWSGDGCICVVWTNGTETHVCQEWGAELLEQCRQDAFQEFKSNMVCTYCIQTKFIVANWVAS